VCIIYFLRYKDLHDVFLIFSPFLISIKLTDGYLTMNCIHCHGQMKRSNAPFHVDRKGYHLMFDTVPAWVCDQCGEAYFEEREVTAIQSAIKGLDQQARQLVADT